MSTSQKNGAAVAPGKNETVKASIVTSSNVQQKEADKILKTETAAAKVLEQTQPKFSVENQKERNRKLNALFEKHAKLTDSRENLADFNVGAESHLNRLELSDNKGSEFKTNNPVVIGKVIDLLRLEIETNLQTTEREIENA